MALANALPSWPYTLRFVEAFSSHAPSYSYRLSPELLLLIHVRTTESGCQTLVSSYTQLCASFRRILVASIDNVIGHGFNTAKESDQHGGLFDHWR
jgi:hypothetical protein